MSKKMKKEAKVQTALTTEEQELKFRQERAQKEKMVVEVIEKEFYPYGTYQVTAEKGTTYTVEIRSLKDKINSCSCPDYQVNTLGTCKHIEHVMHDLHKSSKKFSSTSPYVEIFRDAFETSSVSIAWPKENILDLKLKKTLDHYFSSNNTLISSPLIGMASIENALAGVAPEIREKVRVSSHLQSWVNHLKKKELYKLSKDQFLEDVKAGKRSMQMLSVPLYPYQEEGMLHLAFHGRAILADEMGLGKTIQAIAACELLRRLHSVKRVLVITPASLKGEWEEQIANFTGLPTLIVRGNRGNRLEAYKKDSFFYLVNYEQVRSDVHDIQQILAPDIIILDEAQRVKNWQTQTAWAVKQLKSTYAFVLTGTPIENRIDEIYSIMQVVDPTILGPLFKFNRDFYEFNEKGKPVGYKNLTILHQKLKPIMLRRLKSEVEDQLPERTNNNFFVQMHEEQLSRYYEYEDRVAKLLHILKKRPLTHDETLKLQQNLACMRMLADTPYILDDNCKICPKLEELKEILAEIMEGNQNKIIIFSEWERMLQLVREHIQDELKSDFAWHTGSVPQEKRLQDIKRFKNDPTCRFFLTTDSGSTGLNLQVANVVINLDLPWNPAKLEQRIARAWRKNQAKAVQVINLVSENTIEHRMLTTLSQKRKLADGVLDGVDALDRMSLPSASKEILNELEEMLREDSSSNRDFEATPVTAKTDPVENIKNHAIANFNDRIQSLDLHENNGSKTLFAVVDKLDKRIETRMREFAQSEEPPVNIEMLDQQTYALLKRLAEQGLISINTNASQSLYRSQTLERDFQTENKRLLKEAKQHLDEAERKLKMANLLLSGDFFAEALSPAKEALVLGLKCQETLKLEEDKKGQSLLKYIQDGDENNAKVLLEHVNERLQYYAENVTKFALGLA